MKLESHPDSAFVGPMDLRPIGPAEVDPVSHDITHRLRAVWPAEGHRAAVTASLAAILGGVIVLSEFGGDEAVVDILRRHLATAERRLAERAAGVPRATVN